VNRAERRADERAHRRAKAVLHLGLLPGGCSRCRGAARLRWFGLVDAFDVLGFEAVNVLLGPLGDAVGDDDQDLSIWACECGGSGAIAW
jgi:hypothetical protein